MRAAQLFPFGRRFVVLVCILLADGVTAAAAWAQAQQKQVLILYSTRRDAQIVAVSERILPQIVEAAAPEGVDYYSEYIDQARFPDPNYQVALRDFLRLKYQDKSFDLVMAMQDLSIEFLERYRADLFVGSPIVFFSSEPEFVRPPHATGVRAPMNFAGSIDLALQLQPDTRNVFVVTGSDPADRLYERLARAQFQPYTSKLQITYLVGRPTRELEAQLAKLPSHSIIYYVLVNRDGAGQLFHPLEYLDRIASVANAPIYSWVNSTMDHGIVGGSLKNQQTQTEAMGALAARVLKGEAPDSIPLLTRDLNVNEVDLRQIRRWGIREGRIPDGTVIRFREVTVWDRYKVYIIAAVALMVAQTALVAGLLVLARRRRQAEARAQASQAQLLASYERLRDLGMRLLHAQEDERARIARELHDDISQQLALLSIDIDLLKGSIPREAEALASEVQDRTQRISRGVHDLSHRLHPAKLRLIGLVPSLRALQREMAPTDMRFTFTYENVPEHLPQDLTLCVFRVVQEALHNAVKYSRAREVSVTLRGTASGLDLVIADDGVGFDVDAAWGSGLGLLSMRERIEAIGGTIEVRSAPGKGTRLHVSTPAPPVREDEEDVTSNDDCTVERADSA